MSVSVLVKEAAKDLGRVFRKALEDGWQMNTPGRALPPDCVIQNWIERGYAEAVFVRSFVTPLGVVEERLHFIDKETNSEGWERVLSAGGKEIEKGGYRSGQWIGVVESKRTPILVKPTSSIGY